MPAPNPRPDVRADRSRRWRITRGLLRGSRCPRAGDGKISSRPRNDWGRRREIGDCAAMLPGAERMPYVFAYHESSVPAAESDFDGTRCDVYYHGKMSPDFYGWVSPW